MVRLRGDLPLDAGTTLTTILTRMASEAPPDPLTNQFDPFDARLADALTELASLRIAEDADADRATVVVHADVAALTGDAASMAELEGGARLAAETARRLACDCRWQLVAEDGSGDIVRLGRTTRQPPAWMVRHLRRRDHGCRFPGCGRTRWLHAHHAVHWIDDGPTDADNLFLLCGYHHRFVHEGGWAASGNASGEVVLTAPGGRTITAGLPPLRSDVQRRLFGPDPPPEAA